MGFCHKAFHHDQSSHWPGSLYVFRGWLSNFNHAYGELVGRIIIIIVVIIIIILLLLLFFLLLLLLLLSLLYTITIHVGFKVYRRGF